MDADAGKGDALCRVCGDKASGKHYGVASCDGCRGFFKRSIRRNLDYVCKESGRCVVDVTRRNQCQACRFSKCLQVNMKKDAVQHERAPRSHVPVDGYPGYPGHGPLRRHGAAAPIYPLEAASGVGLFPHSAASYLHQQLVYQQGALKGGFGTPGIPLGFHLQFPAPTPPRPSAPTYRLPSTPKEDEVTSSEEARSFKDNTEAKDEPAPRMPMSASTTSLGWQYAFRPLDLTCLTLMPAENVYESAAKLLFLAVKWARSIPSFLQLSYRDQATLLEEAWSDLFVLSAAQWALPVDEEMLVMGALAPASRHSALEEDARRLRETVSRFVMLRVDHTEYACLKALVLFQADARGVRDPGHVEVLQEQTHVMLHEYCGSRHKARFGKLLLMLPSVHRLSRQSLEELFFKKTVGDVPIERLLGDMVKSTISH